MSEAIKLLIGTRKGAWTLRSDTAREAWALDGPLFLGHFVADPHRPEVMLMATSGPPSCAHRMAARPGRKPRGRRPFRRATPRAAPDHSFWLEPGHPSEPGVWWVGKSPPALFRSADGG